jgi:hypothetical protein
MNTHNTPAPGLLHESSRTSVSTNFDVTAGAHRRTFNTSHMAIRRVGDEIEVRFGMRTTEVNETRLAAQRARNIDAMRRRL